jgi:hypothetical protein
MFFDHFFQYEFECPKLGSSCCNMLLALDLDSLDAGWSALPYPRAKFEEKQGRSRWSHHRDVSLYTRGSSLHMRFGRTSRVHCPCCGGWFIYMYIYIYYMYIYILSLSISLSQCVVSA